MTVLCKNFVLASLMLVGLRTAHGLVETCEDSALPDVHSVSLLQSMLQLDGHHVDAEAEHAEAPKPVAQGERKIRPFIFIKTHKTGSGTMADILLRKAAASNLSIMNPVEDTTHLGWPGPFPGREELKTYGPGKHQFDGICNHAVFNDTTMRAYTKENPFVFTVIRHPISQTGSAWSFYQTEKGLYPDLNTSWDARVQFLEDSTPIRFPRPHDSKALMEPTRFVNSQAHDFGWYEEMGNTSNDNKNDVIDKWLDGLEHKLDFVFVTEAYDEGLILLRKHFELTLAELMYLRIHVSDDHGTREAPTEDQEARLEPFLHVDNLMYARFNESFWRSWDQAGGYAALSEDLEKLRSLNEEVAKACPTNEDTEFDDPCLLKYMKHTKM